MKKRTLVLGMAVVMSMAMVTGCGSNKDDYVNDIEEIAALSELDTDTDDMNAMMDTMKEAIDDLDVSTAEGKDIKKDMADLIDLTSDLVADLDALADMDEEELEEMQTEMEELQSKIEEDVEAFVEAAEEAGVDEDDLADFDVADFGL